VWPSFGPRNQETSFQCPKVKDKVEVNMEYSKIFHKKIEARLFQILIEITSIREVLEPK
jgi:hypothetical protein